MIKKFDNNFIFIIIFLFLFAIDRFIKGWIVKNFTAGKSISIIDDFFSITYVQNYGAAFGIFQGKGKILTIFTVIIAVLLFIFITKTYNIYMKFILTIIFSGAVGNIVDRILYGYVVDMFDFHGIWKFVFNFADVCIVLGTFFMLIFIFLEEKNDIK